MTPSGPAICLSMIVKNEMANLERCLASVADHIACWVIADTGSSDRTPEFITDFFARRGIPGELCRIGFVNFEQARNAALDRARASSLAFNYLLMTDADMELTVQDAAAFSGLTADAYQMVQDSGVVYWNTRLLKRASAGRYRGVTHEYLDTGVGAIGRIEGARFVDHATGANRGGKFARDIELLRTALETEADPFLAARYTFYLANSLRDHGDAAAAVETYFRRAGMGYWDQEIYCSLYQAGRLMEGLGQDADAVLSAYGRASALCPARAEAVHAAARLLRLQSRFAESCAAARPALELAPPQDGLFIEPWIYRYGLRDEYAVSAYWAGRYRESLDANLAALESGAVPAEMMPRLFANMRFALDAMNR